MYMHACRVGYAGSSSNVVSFFNTDRAINHQKGLNSLTQIIQLDVFASCRLYTYFNSLSQRGWVLTLPLLSPSHGPMYTVCHMY